MGEEELIEFLKSNLKLDLEEDKEDSTYCYDGKNRLRISLKLKNEEIDYINIYKDDIEWINGWNM